MVQSQFQITPLQILELLLLALEKGPAVIRATRDALKNDQAPTVDKIIAKMNSMAPPFQPKPNQEQNGE